ncbi:hypothetical protein MTO96_034689 [Rhipicephalus appendiculatus]
MNKGDDAVPVATGSPGHSQVKKRAPGGATAQRGRAAVNAPTKPSEKTTERPSRSEPAGEDVTTAEQLVETTAKLGRAARGPTRFEQRRRVCLAGEGFLSRCEAKFGMDTLPHSTTTTADAVSMLKFASSRRLHFGAFSELVTIVNKLFAPAEDILPADEAPASALPEMP